MKNRQQLEEHPQGGQPQKEIIPVLAQCWLWLAQYGPNAVVPTWTMWQYTEGASGPQPHQVNGIGHCDRDKFNGTEDQLRALWQGSASS